MSDKIKNGDIDIFIYSHIPFRPIAKDHVYKVLTTSHAEPGVFNTDLEILRDYEGDNIANNNIMYNEYSGFYWLWKNYPLKKYIGLNHYRRMYLNYNDLPDIDEIFKTKRIILNEPVQLIVHKNLPQGGTHMTNREWYKYWHNIEDFELLEKIIHEDFPEYIDGFNRMAESKYLYACSLFIMDRDTFIRYCNFIFPVLSKFRKERGFFNKSDCVKYVEENKDKYIKPGLDYYNVEMQSRIVGYIAERALGAFLMNGGDQSLEANAEIFKWAMVPEEYYKV